MTLVFRQAPWRIRIWVKDKDSVSYVHHVVYTSGEAYGTTQSHRRYAFQKDLILCPELWPKCTLLVSEECRFS